MVDIVYILGNGSKWSDNEIKYSIRSILKYVKNYRHIWIVGHCPQIELALPTKFIPLAPKANHKTANIRAALKEIANTEECLEKFVYMNDDFFFTQEVDAELIPNYYCGTLGARASNYSKDSPAYWRTICYTWAVLSALGYPTRDYEVHGPILMEKSKVLTALTLQGTDSASQLRSVYANLHGGAIQPINDSKIGFKTDANLNKEKFLKLIAGRPFFSIGDELPSEIKNVFEELYPKQEKGYVPIAYQPALDKLNEEFNYMI